MARRLTSHVLRAWDGGRRNRTGHGGRFGRAKWREWQGGLRMDFGGGQILQVAGLDLAHLSDADFSAGMVG